MIEAKRRSVSIAVGEGEGDTTADLWVGGDDWTAVVSRERPVPVGRCRLGGLGVQAAAALAMAEAAKDLDPDVPTRRIETELRWNLLDGRLSPAPAVDLARPMQAPTVAILGLGAVGASAVALLSMTPVVGAVDIVDPDLLATEWAADVLRDAGWEVRTHPTTVRGWRLNRLEPGYKGIALVSVHSLRGRRDAADLLAATTITATTSGRALHVERHLAGDEDYACPYCGLVEAPTLESNPIAHVAWLAGALLAAEVVKAALGQPGLDRRVDIDLHGTPLGGWRRPPRDQSGRCICSNPIRRSLARSLYD